MVLNVLNLLCFPHSFCMKFMDLVVSFEDFLVCMYVSVICPFVLAVYCGAGFFISLLFLEMHTVKSKTKCFF